jgi:hypothetical protein
MQPQKVDLQSIERGSLWIGGRSCGTRVEDWAVSLCPGFWLRKEPAGPPGRGGLHHPAKAKRVVQLFMSGAASHCDLFDYKPKLIEKAGQPFDPGGKVELFQSTPGVVMPSPWKWRKRGHCEKWCSDLLPHLSAHVDDMAFVHSMVSKSNVHGPATFMQATGFVLTRFSKYGSLDQLWARQSEREFTNLRRSPRLQRFCPQRSGKLEPLDFSRLPIKGLWYARAEKVPIADLFPPEEAKATVESEKASRSLLELINRKHREDRIGDSRLDARIASYELAAKMQVSAPEVLDLSRETTATKKRYGLDEKLTGRFWPKLFDCPTHVGTRCSLRAGLERGGQWVSASKLGQPRRPSSRPRRNGHRIGQADRRPDRGPEGKGIV